MNIIKKLINLLLSKAKKSLQWFLVLFSGLARICKLSTHQDQGRRVCDNDGTDKDLNILNIRHTLATSGVPSIPSEEQQIIPFSVAGSSSAHSFLQSQPELLFHTHALDLDWTADLIHSLLPSHLLMRMGTMNLL